jgi:hypothetical protein
VDYARVLKDLADIHFAHAKTIVLVQDNLSIHSKASLYEAFPAVLSLGPVNHSSRNARHEEPIGAFLPAGSGRNASNPRLLGGDAAFVYWLVET